ncbi:carbohydrate-binding family 9-like protein [Pontibacter pamirensis]|uniref:carbohydrate-binding family 9-like protein n=1 Tax=Pontibacter pamirensis TaxID=2562824 RepID=UPI001389ABED|nr:carbohydrate-binding family 9-like protein [Pontibacter pamirensis]
MKQIRVPHTAAIDKHSSLTDISDFLDTLEKNAVGHHLWPVSATKPEVTFAIAHHSDCLFLKYYVSESALRAVCLKPNEPVYQDSCVEFFVAFDKDKYYYNLEFNCLGTCLLGYGNGRNDRQLLPVDVITQIKHLAVIQSASSTLVFPSYTWQLTLMIPIGVFTNHRYSSLQGVKSRTNFYKCGDELPEPHFLAWSEIDAPAPDFHLPEFFGQLDFE